MAHHTPGAGREDGFSSMKDCNGTNSSMNERFEIRSVWSTKQKTRQTAWFYFVLCSGGGGCEQPPFLLGAQPPDPSRLRRGASRFFFCFFDKSF